VIETFVEAADTSKVQTRVCRRSSGVTFTSGELTHTFMSIIPDVAVYVAAVALSWEIIVDWLQAHTDLSYSSLYDP
jgi:hypothetical protein